MNVIVTPSGVDAMLYKSKGFQLSISLYKYFHAFVTQIILQPKVSNISHIINIVNLEVFIFYVFIHVHILYYTLCYMTLTLNYRKIADITL